MPSRREQPGRVQPAGLLEDVLFGAEPRRQARHQRPRDVPGRGQRRAIDLDRLDAHAPAHAAGGVDVDAPAVAGGRACRVGTEGDVDARAAGRGVARLQARDVVPRRDHAFGQQEAGDERLVLAGRAHDHGERRPVDEDLERRFDGDDIGRGGAAVHGTTRVEAAASSSRCAITRVLRTGPRSPHSERVRDVPSGQRAPPRHTRGSCRSADVRAPSAPTPGGTARPTRIVTMPQGHHVAGGGRREDLQRRRHLVRGHGQRVVARRQERARHTREDTSTAVVNRRSLAVHRRGRSDHRGAECRGDALMSEAHAQDRHRRREGTDGLGRDPPSEGVQGPGEMMMWLGPARRSRSW